ncbi:MAG: radical SAM protein, partial [Candidatus Aenigmarchaeota archaeon]|nr:radical SAM protein [Candidatus Aenigmarchaeota archaeon]
MQEAMLWHRERNGVRCDLCARRCFIAKDKFGFCLVRKNIDNKLYSLNYGRLISVNIDPIEKKPLFHFHPGSTALSVAARGCNFRCQFCFEPRTRVLTNEGLLTFENLFNKGNVLKFEDGFISFLGNYTTITHTGKVSKITKVYKHPYDGELVVIKPYNLPELKATPSHEFLVYDRDKIIKIPAKDITNGHFLVIPKFIINGEDTKKVDLKDILSNRVNNSFFSVKIFGEEVINSFLNGLENAPRAKESKFFENRSYNFIPIRKIYAENFSGFVYNLEVEDEDHSYLSNFVSVSNCCNWQISHDGLAQIKDSKEWGEKYSPEEIVKLAEKNNCKSISYTYTEPTIFFEFAYRTAKLAHRSNILNTFVTNGYITEDALKKMKYLDAATVDFKASGDPEFYKKFMSVPDVSPIFDALKQMKKQRIFIEITDLIVPQVGDSIELCRKLAEWVNAELGSEIPFHVLQFHPDYKLLELPFT